MKQLVEQFRNIVAKVEAKMLPYLKTINPDIETVHYEHGHYKEILNTLISYGNTIEFNKRKYPLIALFEDVGISTTRGIQEARFSMVICYDSIGDIRSEERYEKVIKPILIPLYNELVKQIIDSGYSLGYNLTHEMIIHPFYGSEKKEGANIFADILDSIELRNIKLKLREQSMCEFPTILKS